ncbi:MAG: sodium-dependent transporter [Actinomycetota bacterium]
MASRDPKSLTILSAVADAARYPRAVWGSERAYVLATIAGVVGLGNIWRFPYMAGLNGGGSFVLAYVICVLLIAIPLASLESAAGSLGRRSPVGAFRRAAGPAGVAVGWAVLVLATAILSYYLVVTGWTLGYALDAVRGEVRLFREFVGGYTSLWLFFAVALLVYLVLLRGVKAVEKASLYLVPVLIVIVAGLTFYALTLDGAGAARDFYFGLSGEFLTDPATWRAAAGQAFYSIGIGQGLLLVYGSYVPAGTNLVRSTATIAITNSAVSVIAGLMVFAVVFTFGLSPSAGSELSFTAFPRVFAVLPGGALLAVAFFVLLFLAGFTSCLGAATVISATVRDELGMNLRRAAAFTVGLVVLLGIPSALSFTDLGLSIGGEPVLGRVDRLTGAGAIVVLGLAGAALLAYKLPRRRLVAAFVSDHKKIGKISFGPRLIIVWTLALPFVAAVLYTVGTIA